jgi:NADP-dependent 3-hydroxy acid dehydrogenase YdfG
MSTRLKDCIAIVTGASSGIGEATARALALEGAAVVLVARRQDRLEALASDIERSGGTALAIAGDITERSSAEAAVEQTIARFGRIDILVNNAGVMIVGPVAEQSVEDWERMIDLNQKALLYVTKAALPHLKAAAVSRPRRVADIVNVSSLAGRIASANFGVYSMTKFGLNGFTEALRQEMAPAHVRVGVLEPGAVKTELNDHHTGDVRDFIDKFFASIETLDAADIAGGVAFMVTRPRHATVRELFIMPSEQAG